MSLALIGVVHDEVHDCETRAKMMVKALMRTRSSLSLPYSLPSSAPREVRARHDVECSNGQSAAENRCSLKHACYYTNIIGYITTIVGC